MVVDLISQTLYTTSFPEDAPLNSVILTVQASDADTGNSSEIEYSLFGIGVEDFYMDANTGMNFLLDCVQVK